MILYFATRSRTHLSTKYLKYVQKKIGSTVFRFVWALKL